MSRHRAEPGAILPPPAASLAACLILTLLAATLGMVVRGDRHMPGDIALLEAIQSVDLPGLDALVAFSNLVFSTGGALVLAALFIAVAVLRRRADLVLQVIVVIVVRLAFEVWKPIFHSPRPGIEFQPDPSLVSNTLGYPSGHSQTAAIVASMLVIFVRSLDLPRAVNRTAYVIAVGVTALALVSRIHIGAHWPSDTIGGVLFGLAAVALMWRVVQWIAGRRPGHARGQNRYAEFG